MKQLIECVPNISEGRDMNIINQVTAEIEKVEGVKLLDVDPGQTTNRTVITFVGEPEQACEAAFRVVQKAAELIDMRNHHGAHPRQGATDVCPLIPVSNISMEEVVEYAHKLGKRLGEELNIPIYCYENAAFQPKRRNLAYCRTGEYESLSSRLARSETSKARRLVIMLPRNSVTSRCTLSKMSSRWIMWFSTDSSASPESTFLAQSNSSRLLSFMNFTSSKA